VGADSQLQLAHQMRQTQLVGFGRMLHLRRAGIANPHLWLHLTHDGVQFARPFGATDGIVDPLTPVLPVQPRLRLVRSHHCHLLQPESDGLRSLLKHRLSALAQRFAFTQLLIPCRRIGSRIQQSNDPPGYSKQAASATNGENRT
jgi:hypothetical protein